MAKQIVKTVLVIFLVIILGAFIFISIAFYSLMSVEEMQYDNPNQSQISHFLECCGLNNLPIESADYLAVSNSPHQSDTRMVLVFSEDVTDWWDGFTTCSEGRTVQLPNNNTMNCTAEKLISTFVWAYRVSSDGEMKSVLSVSNVSGEDIDQLAGLG